jgi:hypothetical protein
MRKKMGFVISLIALLLFVSSVCHGYDTDLYVLSGVNIPPNVLIILDSSASMDEVSSGQNYDPTIDYSLYAPSTIYPGNEVYYKSGKTGLIQPTQQVHFHAQTSSIIISLLMGRRSIIPAADIKIKIFRPEIS